MENLLKKMDTSMVEGRSFSKNLWRVGFFVGLLFLTVSCRKQAGLPKPTLVPTQVAMPTPTVPGASPELPQPIQVPTPTPELTPTLTPTPTPPLPKPTIKPGWKSHYNGEIGFTYQLPLNSWQSIQHPEDSLCDLRLERNEGDQYICVRSMSNPKGLSRRNFFCYEVIFFGRGEEHDIQESCFKYLQVQELKIGNRDALKIYFASGGSDAGDYYVLSNKGRMIVISDYYALFPKTANPSGFSWKTLRDEVVATFWFE